jgi:predicted MPP superfamily phosphohydrolase
VAIDASGDAGLRNSDTKQLVIAAVITYGEEQTKLLVEAINSFRRYLGWVDLHEFKFSKTEKSVIVDLINHVKGFEYHAFAVVLNKTQRDTNSTPKGKVPVYNQVMKELLLKVSKNNQLVTIDGKSGKLYDKKVKAYLRQTLRDKGIINSHIRFVDSRNDALVQLADIIAGAVARTFKDKTDAQRYLNLLKDKIVCIDELSVQT